MEKIPFNTLAPLHDEAVSEAVLSVLKDNRFILGERLAAFEREFAAFTDVAHCIGTGNGHDALVLALRALGLGTGVGTAGITARAGHPRRETEAGRIAAEGPDEVLVPANTYVATWLAVTNAGCVPVPVEPDPKTMNIDPGLIEARITPRTKAILPVHLYGNPCDMGAIMALAGKYNLKVVEDNAQAHGATYQESLSGHVAGSGKAADGRVAGKADARIAMTGSFGDINATSFYPTKNLGALGDGGAVTTNDASLAARVLMLRNYGFSSRAKCDEVGINSRLDEIHAAALSVKLKRLEGWNEERRAIARMYGEALDGVGDVVLPAATEGGKHVYHIYAIQTSRRDKLQAHLERMNIQTMVHYPVPPHRQKAYEGLGYGRGSFPVSERLAAEVLSLPVWVGMSEAQVQRVCDGVRSFY